VLLSSSKGQDQCWVQGCAALGGRPHNMSALGLEQTPIDPCDTVTRTSTTTVPVVSHQHRRPRLVTYPDDRPAVVDDLVLRP